MGEKDDIQTHEKPDHGELRSKVVSGHEAFAEAMMKEPPSAFTKAQMLVYCFSVVAFFCSTMNGYDGSLINNLLQNPWFKQRYKVENDGIWAGIVSSMYQIGGVVALPFVGPAIDGFGRRAGMLIGAGLIVIGTIIQGLSDAQGQFMGGRFVLGFGVSLAAAAGPMYVVEMNHPAYRGRALFSGLIILFCMFLPESPRWLYVHNKKEAAKAVLARYHGNGDADSAWVALQLSEYEQLLNMDGADKRWWDYRALFRNRAAVYRLMCNVAVSVFGQWAGNAVLSYFLGSVLDTAGYTSAIAQANITLVNNCQQFAFAILGAFLVDKVGRRPLLLFSLAACTVVWLGMTMASSRFAASYVGDDAGGDAVYGNPAASKAALAMVFIFGAVYSVGITPLQALFPVEVLSFEMRAKGMAFSSFAVNAAGLLNQFAWPVSMDKIGWRTYIIFTVWDLVQTTVVYFFIPETKGRTLEELDEIFDAPNPVKASTAKKAVAVDSRGGIVNIEKV
ncbi:hypothetical protein Trco_003628 [Trichoderma cornu-damae]|uniref:Major facilitator superfamily (MFS) profile domain-containing protein n=1 Tax=Trichoderma cornu-damae TaxID=654480 RepID=A0A9P8QKZ0_9HYPO|nr:hypothetical protein Trco_003628 [Trichoderma cornu-damae]